MANFNTTIYTAQTEREISLHQDASLRDLQANLRVVRVQYTCGGSEANTDTIKLCFPQIEGYLIPELSRATNPTAAGDCDLDFVLQKVATDGTATSISGAASVDNNSAAFARISTGTPIIEREDHLQVVISNRDASASGEVVLFELAFYVPNAV